MNIFKKIFKKEKKDKKESQEFEERDLPMCPFCNVYIESWEKSKKFDKQRYHLKCMRKLKKQALKSTIG